jgi:CheY-like chemotaxis protein
VGKSRFSGSLCMKDYLKRPEDVNRAVRILRKNGIQVGLPTQKADGAMLFPVEELMLTADQILELSDKNELDREGLRRFREMQKPDRTGPASTVQDQATSEADEVLRILVVDDSAISRKLAEYAFLGEPYEVSVAENGQEALELMINRRPDVVITDWVMPDLSGLDLCQMIRNKLNCKDTYVILLTSNTGDGDIAKGIAAGADGHLTKPLQTDKLFSQIRMARAVLKARRSSMGLQASDDRPLR